MTERYDTTLRYLLLAIAGVTILVMILVAGSDGLSRQARFLLLMGLAIVAVGGWPGTELAQRYVTRRPLLLGWGKPSQETVGRAAPPAAEPAPPLPAAFVLTPGPSVAALAVGLVVAVVGSIGGYALAGSPNRSGGMLIYVGAAAGLLLAARSLLRMMTARRALILDQDTVTLGWALGYAPPKHVSRTDMAAIDVTAGPHTTIGFVSAGGRRFEVRPDHLARPELSAVIAAIYPELEWRAVGAQGADQ